MKAEIFAAYGDNVEDAIRNWQQVDPVGYDAFARRAVGRMYLADYRRWSRSKTIEVKLDKPAADRLFPAPSTTPAVTVRSSLVFDGDELNLMDLAGAEGAAKIRQITTRDSVPAKTTLERCAQYLAYADLIESESVRMGRPVSVREALGLAA